MILDSLSEMMIELRKIIKNHKFSGYKVVETLQGKVFDLVGEL